MYYVAHVASDLIDSEITHTIDDNFANLYKAKKEINNI